MPTPEEELEQQRQAESDRMIIDTMKQMGHDNGDS